MEEITDDKIAQMDAKELVDNIIVTFDMDEIERARVQALMKIRAKELKLSSEVAAVIRAYTKADKINADHYTLENALQEATIPLAFDGSGKPCNSIDNILLIMKNDARYAGIKYNELLNAPEIAEKGSLRPWNDTDDAESRRYIEKRYGIHNAPKHFDALRVLFRDRRYHPIRDIVDKLEWDGEERIGDFLTKWMKAEDSAYTREVSRLIFAGGINRLYSPGCKFDEVPVLIGTSQGEGKSSIVRWLAMEDKFYSEVTEIDGQRGIEQLDGAWICEIAELFAITKTKEQEGVKSYITRQHDKLRRPYDRQPTDYPRRCVFVGTTNSEHFLKDKTGNRRYYPVKVHSVGYWLFDHETECREYIRQCWAEAKAKYDRGEMPNYANKELRDTYKAVQDEAMEDDWRIGVIEEYLSRKSVGALVCIKQIANEALSSNPDFPQNPTPKDSQEIGQLMRRFPEWKKCEKKRRIDSKYGPQWCWERTDDFQVLTDDLALPFDT